MVTLLFDINEPLGFIQDTFAKSDVACYQTIEALCNSPPDPAVLVHRPYVASPSGTLHIPKKVSSTFLVHGQSVHSERAVWNGEEVIPRVGHKSTNVSNGKGGYMPAEMGQNNGLSYN